MSAIHSLLLEDGALDFAHLDSLRQKPPLFELIESHFWDDPHIAQQMLIYHLDPNTDAASHRPAIIDARVRWIMDRLSLDAGKRLLDLGCGPGLYARRFAEKGLQVTGVDLSQNSLNYAREQDPHSTYICQDYRTLDDLGQFDVVTLIAGDLCVLSDSDRDQLLRFIHQSLSPGGYFVFDVTTYTHHAPRLDIQRWSVHPSGGFWKPTPHLQLMQGYHYPEADTALEQFIIIEADGQISVYRNWFHYYNRQTVTDAVTHAGFTVVDVVRDLSGEAYRPESDWIGIVARKRI